MHIDSNRINSAPFCSMKWQNISTQGPLSTANRYRIASDPVESKIRDVMAHLMSQVCHSSSTEPACNQRQESS